MTGSARLDYLKKSGDSLAGRFFALQLHSISIKEWCDSSGANAPDALTHPLERGGFPESTLAANTGESERWRMQYLDGLNREDTLEFSRLHEVNTMRVLVQLLRDKVGSPLSVASLARDLNASTTTIFRYIQILEALYVVFTITPWHKNVARSLLKAPKIYFYDTGLVRGDEAEVDFALVKGNTTIHLIECKLSGTKVHPALARFSAENPNAKSLQLLRHCRQSNHHQTLTIVPACEFLHELV